jgi:guanine deaminase
MATLGGARVLRMEDRVGAFEVGKQFDAILVDMRGDTDDLDIRGTGGQHAMLDWPKEELSDARIKQMWQMWIMTGDDRNLRNVWVGGQKKKSSGP